ncbi:MAG: flippase [Gemmatimonadota bacterium]
MALGLGEAAARVLTFLGHALIARRLGVGVYGVVSLASAAFLYLQRIADAGLTQGLGLRELAADPDNAERLAPSLIVARLALSVAVAVLVVAAALLFLPQPDGTVVAVMALVLLPYGASPLWVALGLRQTRPVATSRTLAEAAVLLLLVVGVRDAGDVARVPLAQLIGEGVAAVLVGLALRRVGLTLRPRFSWTRVRPLVGRALPLMLSGLMALVVYNSDFFFLRIFRDSHAVGLYGVAYMLVSFLLNLGTAFNQSLLPTLTGLGADRAAEQELHDASMAHVWALTLPAAVGGIVLSGGIIGLAFGERYAQSASALAWLLPSVPLVLMRGVSTMALIARGREDRVLRINLIATGVNLALNFALIPGLGILGAALSTVGTETVRLAAAFGHARAEGFGLTFLRRLWRPLVAAAVMAVALHVAGLHTLLAVPAGALVYGAVLTALGGLRWTGGRPQLAV